MEQAKILVTATFSLRQHALEKTALLFDTVLFDDASLINETDCLAALSHGANRAILLGNRTLNQNMFLLNPSSINKTLFYRIKSTLDLEPVALEKTAAKSSPSKATSPKKRGKAKQSATSPTKTEQPLPPQIIFVDSSLSAE